MADDVRLDGPPSTVEYDVAVVGGGPAGCAAGVFTARYGLETIVLDRGRSSIRRCAYLENYLGFPAGIDVDTFCRLARDHAEEAGCTIVSDLVESVERSGDGFLVAPQEGDPVATRFVVAATKYDGEYLRPLDDGSTFAARERDGETRDTDGETHESFDAAFVDDDGRTPVEGLYVAGPLGGAGDQALIAAGDGAAVARTLISDVRTDDGYWDRFAERYDWVRRADELTAEWTDRDTWAEWFDEQVPEDLDLDEDAIERLRERYIDDRFDAYVGPEEIERRTARGQRRLATHLEEAALLDALDDRTVLDAIDDDAIADYLASTEEPGSGSSE